MNPRYWAKGINPGAFDGKYSRKTQAAFESMQKDAGFSTPDGKWSAMWMKPLCDMSQFTLIQGGDSRIRTMQQDLNKKLYKYTGILPCDGFYQRETNTALIYGLQVAIGMADVANGVYGPGTIEKCPTLSAGSTGDVVKILQYGLYVNKVYTGSFDGQYSSAVAASVHGFRKIMNLAPIDSEVAPNRVMKGLLTSNGDTTRDSIACDTSRQLTEADVKNLKSYGFSIVGRYLTGTVGSGADETPKNLTNAQGYSDGLQAISAARLLGFTNDTLIYFACDLDLLEGEISSTIIPYMQGVNTAFKQVGRFRVGIYGTRNVAQHVIDSGLAIYAFVSDMSTGYSGNLGYPMATPWAFDQFIEYPIAGTPIDQVAVNDDQAPHDIGCKTFTPGKATEQDNIIAMAKLLGGHITNVIDFELGKEYIIGANQNMRVTFKGELGAGDGPIKIKNGTIDEVELKKQLEKQFGSYKEAELTAVLNKTGIKGLGAKVSSGGVKIGAEMTTGGLLITMEESVKGMMHQDNLQLDCKLTYEVLIYKGYFSGNDALKELETDAQKIRAGVLIGLTWLTNQEKTIWAIFEAFLGIIFGFLAAYAAAVI